MLLGLPAGENLPGDSFPNLVRLLILKTAQESSDFRTLWRRRNSRRSSQIASELIYPQPAQATRWSGRRIYCDSVAVNLTVRPAGTSNSRPPEVGKSAGRFDRCPVRPVRSRAPQHDLAHVSVGAPVFRWRRQQKEIRGSPWRWAGSARRPRRRRSVPDRTRGPVARSVRRRSKRPLRCLTQHASGYSRRQEIEVIIWFLWSFLLLAWALEDAKGDRKIPRYAHLGVLRLLHLGKAGPQGPTKFESLCFVLFFVRISRDSAALRIERREPPAATA